MNSFLKNIVIAALVLICVPSSAQDVKATEQYDIQRNNMRYGYHEKVWTPVEAGLALQSNKGRRDFHLVYTLHCTPQRNLISVYSFSWPEAFSSNVIYRPTQQQVFCDPSNGKIDDPKNLSATVR